MIGLLAQGAAVASAPFADEWAHGADALAANGAIWARLPGEAGGASGLGLSGIGEGGGGLGQGIGLGTVGTLGHAGGPVGPGTGGQGSPLSLQSGWGNLGPTGIGEGGSGLGEGIGLGALGSLGHHVVHHVARAYSCGGG